MRTGSLYESREKGRTSIQHHPLFGFVDKQVNILPPFRHRFQHKPSTVSLLRALGLSKEESMIQ